MNRTLACFGLLLLTGCGSGVSTLSNTVPRTTPLPLAPFSTCVTFIGDSLTANWPMAGFTNYDGGCYLDHGKGGTTMLQVLDGIDDLSLGYNASVDPRTSLVAVVGGDIFNGLAHGYTVEQMEGWYALAIKKLRALGVRPVLCTVLPSGNATFNVQVLRLNAWIRSLAEPELPVVDLYNTPLVQPNGMPNPAEYSPDLIHPLTGAYAQLTGMVEQAIGEVRAARPGS